MLDELLNQPKEIAEITEELKDVVYQKIYDAHAYASVVPFSLDEADIAGAFIDEAVPWEDALDARIDEVDIRDRFERGEFNDVLNEILQDSRFDQESE